MNNLLKLNIVIYFISFSAVFAKEYIYPLKTENIDKKITSVFGEARDGYFHNGIDIFSLNEPVSMIKQGQIIYHKYKEDNPFENELGSGNVIWAYHKNGNLSAYYHLNHKKIDFKSLDIKQGETIGFTGNSGFSSGAHLHFVMMQENGFKVVNPFNLLPKLRDTNSPKISEYIGVDTTHSTVYINNGENYNVNFKVQDKPLYLFTFIKDSGLVPYQKRGIYALKFKWNGLETQNLKFDFLVYSNGDWLDYRGLKYEDIYFKKSYLIGKVHLEKNRNYLQVIAADHNKNLSIWKGNFYFN